jgi:MFS family permease
MSIVSEPPRTTELAPGFDIIARSLAVVSLTDLALVHVIDLPGTLGGTPLIGIGYFLVIAAALAVSAVLMARPQRIAWAATGLLALATGGGYILTRTVSGFLGDHDDVGNWRCSLGIAALSLEAVLVVLAVVQVARRRVPIPVPVRANPTHNSHTSYTSVR